MLWTRLDCNGNRSSTVCITGHWPAQFVQSNFVTSQNSLTSFCEQTLASYKAQVPYTQLVDCHLDWSVLGAHFRPSAGRLSLGQLQLDKYWWQWPLEWQRVTPLIGLAWHALNNVDRWQDRFCCNQYYFSKVSKEWVVARPMAWVPNKLSSAPGYLLTSSRFKAVARESF